MAGWGGLRKKRLRRSGQRRFAYRLALKLGHVNVDRMLRQISIRELGEWRAYADLEPFDESRADLRAGSIVQALLNVHRGKGRAAVKLQDCVLQFRDEASAQSPDQARAQVMAAMETLIRQQKLSRPRGRAGK